MSLKLKIALLFTILLILSTGGLAGLLVHNESRALTSSLARQRGEIAEGLADVCQSVLYSRDDLLLVNYLNHLRSIPIVAEASCIDAQGVIQGDTDHKKMRTPFRDAAGPPRPGPDGPATRVLQRDGRKFLEIAVSVRSRKRTLGVARVLFSHDAMQEEFRRNLAAARRRVLQAAAPIMGAGSLGAFLITGWVIKPIRVLVRAARIIGTGKLDHVIPLKSKDEVGQLATEFNQMAAKLQELDRMKQDFIHSITHDLKSPLSVILIAAEKCLEAGAALPAAGQRLLQENVFLIRQRADRLRNMISEILDAARIESKLTLNRKPVSLEDLADRAVQSFLPQAQQKGIGLEMIAESPLPPLFLDENAMERALANLVGNAIKFTSRGWVAVRVGRGEDGTPELRVEDTGPGIAPEFMDKIFTKFSRAAPPGGVKVEGTGLGLVIAKGLVEAHGGTLRVESVLGQGAVFIAAFPEPGASA